MDAKSRRTKAAPAAPPTPNAPVGGAAGEQAPAADRTESAPAVRALARPAPRAASRPSAPDSEVDITNAVLAGVQRVPLVAVPATEAQNGFGGLVDRAAAGQDIAITRHNVERVVLVSATRYHQLLAGARETLVREVRERERRALLGDVPGGQRDEQLGERQGAAASATTSASPTPALDRLAADFEVLYARMQTPEHRAATASLLDATPEEMGQAAVDAARETARPTAAERGAETALSAALSLG